MHVLVIGQLTGKDYSAHLQEEGQFVGRMAAQSQIGGVWLKADQSGPVLLLNNVTAEQARERLAELPFIVHDLATFDYIEVVDPPSIPQQPSS